MRDHPRIKNFIRKVKIEEVGKAHNYFNNGIKYQTPVLVEYVENFTIGALYDYDDPFKRAYNNFLKLIRMIIVQGFIDVNAKSECKLRRRGRKSAKKFFRKNNEDLITYCKVIKANPNYILNIYHKIKYSKNRKSTLKETLEMKKFSKLLKKC